MMRATHATPPVKRIHDAIHAEIDRGTDRAEVVMCLLWLMVGLAAEEDTTRPLTARGLAGVLHNLADGLERH